MSRSLLVCLLFSLAAGIAHAHAPRAYVPVLPLHVRGAALFDASETLVLLRGVQMSGLEAGDPDAAKAMTALTFRVMQQRWNLNTVRLPLSIARWRREGQGYVDQVRNIVQTANQERLVAVLAATDDPAATGLPGVEAQSFWSVFAAALKDSPGVVFSVYAEPSAQRIPGSSAAARRPADWLIWRDGGALTNGRQSVGMQSLVAAIRAAGASQVVAVSSFHDALGFQGIGPDSFVQDDNVVYESHPTYEYALTDAQRDVAFGFLADRVPVYAGVWGMPFGQDSAACRAVPADLAGQLTTLLQTLSWFDTHNVSWTASDFRPGSLVQDFDEYNATVLDHPGTCGQTGSEPGAGIGTLLLLWTTGDPGGFGSLQPELIASAAGGPAHGPAPGEILALYGQGLGAETPLNAVVDTSGRVPALLGGTQVFFDGIAAPVLLSGSFQVNVQVPYEVAGRAETTVQLFQNGVPSNKLRLPVQATAPELFARFGLPSEGAALNEDGSANAAERPALAGSVISLFATGSGVADPPLTTGMPATGLNPPTAPVSVRVNGSEASVLFAGAAPGLVGVLQINVRVPSRMPAGRAEVVLTVGGQSSRAGLTVWLQ